MKLVVCKLVGLCFHYVTWALGIVLFYSKSWRVWEFNSNVIPIMYLGLWEAFYVQNVNMSGSIVPLPMSTSINGSWVISDEIWYGRDLLFLVNIMKTLTLYFSSHAVSLTWSNYPGQEFPRLCYKTSASFLFFSSLLTLIVVNWNFFVDFHGQTTLTFPRDFPVTIEMVNKKHISYILPLGVIASVLSLTSAIIFICGRYPC